MPFDWNPILAGVCLLSCLPFFLGGRASYLLVGGAFLLCHKKRLEDFYNPKLFFCITAILFGQSLFLHNASSSFRTGSFSLL